MHDNFCSSPKCTQTHARAHRPPILCYCVLGCYTTKHNSQNAKALANVFAALEKYERKLAKQRREAATENEPQRSDRSVGAPLVSFVARGNKIFSMSCKTVVLPLKQMLEFLQGRPIVASVDPSGRVICTAHDYVFRNRTVPGWEKINFWFYSATYEVAKLDEDKSVQSSQDQPSPSSPGAPPSSPGALPSSPGAPPSSPELDSPDRK